MNGARADDSVKTTRSERSMRKISIGPSHHRLEVFKKYQNSPNILRRPLIEVNILMSKI